MKNQMTPMMAITANTANVTLTALTGDLPLTLPVCPLTRKR